ncbi:putative zinc finger (CCCH type) protein [Neospora caninum Liverpool]|uniref:Putative zinc finger (CCCH type) protein n=1 Tax=Neospora caninum (strain Liverpool) TaxID=572307 RepID=F0VPM4_NEOCL|nr:putative zinc finger (CCCH type) protein [Neospora caninum Liverpool]CBZ55671.1 putative zinc finger (CCCH type) protein [Neospora caninum Liverpool]CEL70413.1 TPA: zinc finger (CCCH type) protein, putative [Neospora caninum Liverpool]|eukprot:XP_003885697.1 putative zinc finger (CCCH type) protein [Neospora caninum Liverpool]
MDSSRSAPKLDGFCPSSPSNRLQTDKRHKLTFNNFYKTKLCPWYIKGSCHWGASCNYAHALSEQREAVDLTKTKLCPTWLSHSVCRNPKCRYAHDYSELRATTDVFKTSLCSFFIKGIPCPMENRCRFAHGVQELRPRAKDDLQHGAPGLIQKAAEARAALAAANAAAAAARAAATAKAAAEAKAAADAAIAGLADASGSACRAEPRVSPPVAQVLVPVQEGGHVPLSCAVRGRASAQKNAEGRCSRRQPATGVLALDKESGAWRAELSAHASEFVSRASVTPSYPLLPSVNSASSLVGTGLEGTIELLLQSLQCHSGDRPGNKPLDSLSIISPGRQTSFLPRGSGLESSFNPQATPFSPGAWCRNTGNGYHISGDPLQTHGVSSACDNPLSTLDFSSLLSTVAMAIAASPPGTTKADVPVEAFLPPMVGEFASAPGLSAPWNRSGSQMPCSAHLPHGLLRSADASVSSEGQTTASGGEESSFPLAAQGEDGAQSGSGSGATNPKGCLQTQNKEAAEGPSPAGERLDAAGTLLLTPADGIQTEESSGGGAAIVPTKMAESLLHPLTGSRQTTGAGVDCE